MGLKDYKVETFAQFGEVFMCFTLALEFFTAKHNQLFKDFFLNFQYVVTISFCSGRPSNSSFHLPMWNQWRHIFLEWNSLFVWSREYMKPVETYKRDKQKKDSLSWGRENHTKLGECFNLHTKKKS
ncbi:hypothetical protein YC2023_109340 [Brassica napus]